MTELKDIKGIIFDYGGTIDTAGEHWSHVLRRGWDKAGVAADETHFRDAYVYAERELARTRHILPEHDFSDLLYIKATIELQWLSEQGMFPPQNTEASARAIADYCYGEARRHVEEAAVVLKKLAEKYPLVLVSNFYGNIETVLRDFGIRDYFKKIVESSVVGVRKPDPEIFRLGVKALGLKAEECLVVGDSYRKDIEPALKAGCRAVWIKGPGWDDSDDSREYPLTITSLMQLETLLPS